MSRGLVRYRHTGNIPFLTFSCFHRLPYLGSAEARDLAEKPEEWPWSSFRHYATGVKGAVEIESRWTAFRRGDQLPQHLRSKEPAG